MTDWKEISSATPLNALSAVSLDTETTGLDVNSARLIQVGAIRMARGVIQHDNVFDSLVNPGEPIPGDSTAIHGIRDPDVAGAPDFRGIWPDLNEWVGQSIMIGYSIGFDLSIFRRECELAGVSWTPPRTLDVRLMVRILSPPLPDFSLETIAGWLKVSAKGRHHALSDARMTAEVFLAMLPLLAERGIRTLAELELRCRQVSADRLVQAEAGWHDFLQSPAQRASVHGALARIDSYPYRHRVRQVMSAPVVRVAADAPVREALSVLIDKGISSLIVEPGAGLARHGILTERDLVRAIERDAGAALERPVSNLASSPLITVPQGAFLYRAMGLMRRHDLRHLVAINKDGRITGLLSSGDLLKQRSDDALDLGDAINQAETEQDLGLVWANLALVAQALDGADVDARDTAAVISRELRALTRRCCQIAEKQMVGEGLGGPPAPYAMMVLGSGGRGESLLAMDQDNAIVHADPKAGDEAAVDDWFRQLGERVSALLNATGVPYCDGGVMGMNREWRMSVSEWKNQVRKWISRTSPEDILKTDIFFDAVSVHGDHELMREVHRFAMKHGARSREFLHLLAGNASDVNSPLGAFGRFRLSNGRVDVKLGGILPIFSAARVQAIRHGISERSTPGRLHELGAAGKVNEKLMENLVEAHRILLTSILKQQLYDLDQGISLSNRIAPDAMPAAARNNLRWALQQVTSVTDLLGAPG